MATKERRKEAEEAKEFNLTVLASLISKGCLNSYEGGYWFDLIDRTRSLAAQKKLLRILASFEKTPATVK